MKTDRVMAQKESSEVDALDLVVERVQGRDLAHVVAHKVQQAACYVGVCEGSLTECSR